MSGGPTGAEALAEGRATLAAAGIPGAARDAKRLLAHALGRPSERLSAFEDMPLEGAVLARYRAALADRAGGRPVSKITGKRLFWKGEFLVTDDVLDPRPETETLIAEALKRPFSRVLDLGTGSGCILLSLLDERRSASGVGVDLSAAALAVAARNGKAWGCDRVTWREGFWFDGITERFDLIVSNPPYIAADEMRDLMPEVRNHDPLLALTDGGDGLGAYRAITEAAPEHLIEGGRLIFEIGPSQGAEVAALCRGAGLQEVTVIPDLDGRDRVVLGVRRG